MLRLAFDALNHKNIARHKLLEKASTQGGIYGSHLRRYWENSQSYPELADAIKQLLKTKIGVHLEPSIAYKLESIGLIYLVGDKA